MPFTPRCPQCLVVSRQLGRRVACLLHADLPPAAERAPNVAPPAPRQDRAETPASARPVAPTADAPAPFSLRELARLLVLRSRVREARAPGNPGPRAAD